MSLPSGMLNYICTCTCLTAALKAPRMPAAPPQSLFIPSIDVCKELHTVLNCYLTPNTCTHGDLLQSVRS